MGFLTNKVCKSRERNLIRFPDSIKGMHINFPVPLIHKK